MSLVTGLTVGGEHGVRQLGFDTILDNFLTSYVGQFLGYFSALARCVTPHPCGMYCTRCRCVWAAECYLQSGMFFLNCEVCWSGKKPDSEDNPYVLTSRGCLVGNNRTLNLRCYYLPS